MNTNKPSIFNYLDIVQFFNDHFKWRKSNEANFTYTLWSSELNIGSKTILRFILQRKRRISEKTRFAMKANLKLTEIEGEYFDYLIIYSQARTESERLAAGRQLINIQRAEYRQVEVLADKATNDVLGPVVLTLLTFSDLDATTENLSKIMNTDQGKLQVILDKFVQTNILKFESDRYTLDAEAIKIADSPNLESLKNFHEYWLEKCKEAFRLDFKTRRFRSLKFALTEQEFNVALEKINEFAVYILSKFHTCQINGRRLYMLENILFPITNQLDIEKVSIESA